MNKPTIKIELTPEQQAQLQQRTGRDIREVELPPETLEPRGARGIQGEKQRLPHDAIRPLGGITAKGGYSNEKPRVGSSQHSGRGSARPGAERARRDGVCPGGRQPLLNSFANNACDISHSLDKLR